MQQALRIDETRTLRATREEHVVMDCLGGVEMGKMTQQHSRITMLGLLILLSFCLFLD